MIDVDVNKFLWSFSLVSYFLELIHILRNNICMALGLNSPSSSSSSSLSSPSSSPWITFKSPILLSQGISLSSKSMKYFSMDHNSFSMTISPKALPSFMQEEELLSSEEHKKIDIEESCKNSSPKVEVGRLKVASKIKKRPTKLLVPDNFSALELGEVVNKQGQKEFEMEGKDCVMAGRRGRRDVMEDGYGVITDIMGDSSQAFFGVFDGHGGRAAVNFVTENLGKNIVTALKEADEAENQSRNAIRKGYLVTDEEFLTQEVCSGVCAATVLVKDGELHVANVGDCRVVLSRNGIATALTNDHRLDREDERIRIENSGGYVNCQNGVWRVQGSLAVSRAIGDQHLKQWVIPEPEIKKLELTSECEFLVIASDGLWDKVTNQEAVDMVSRNNSPIESCKNLVDISSSRGNKDDITVMVVNLKNFKKHQG